MTMKVYFKIEEFVISGDTVPVKVADKILHYHILPCNKVREELGVPMTASQKSGYRSVEWEKSRGRSGNSQHTFKGKGAVDWTCNNFKDNAKKMLLSLIDNTEYTRMAVYNTFIHCDYKPTPSGKRELYTSTPDSVWTLKKTV